MKAKRNDPRGTRAVLLQIDAIADGRVLPGGGGPLEQLRVRWLSRLDLALRALKNTIPSQNLQALVVGVSACCRRGGVRGAPPGAAQAANSLIHVNKLGKPLFHAA